MKKVSTAARKQSRNFSQQKLTIGLDLGDRSSCYCVLDETGSIVLEQRVATTPKCGWEGWRQWQLGQRENLVQRKPKRIHLTPTAFSWKAFSQVCAFPSPFSSMMSVIGIFHQQSRIPDRFHMQPSSQC